MKFLFLLLLITNVYASPEAMPYTHHCNKYNDWELDQKARELKTTYPMYFEKYAVMYINNRLYRYNNKNAVALEIYQWVALYYDQKNNIAVCAIIDKIKELFDHNNYHRQLFIDQAQNQLYLEGNYELFMLFKKRQ